MSSGAILDRIGHYRILGKLGEGGMGTVYTARDERLERLVALKVIRARGGDVLSKERFWREARAAARVSHPNICQLYEVGEHEDGFFLSMELLRGQSLADRISRAPLSAEEAIDTAVHILTALDALHREGIVHRDLKPSNVFLAEHAVKLLDFGLATAAVTTAAAGDVATIGSLTGRGEISGTPRYMAPEQVRGEPVDARTDIFAAGAVLFEMLAGRPAFTADTVVDVLHAVLHDPAPDLSASHVAAPLVQAVHRALSKNPSDRYPSAASMIEELRGGGLQPAQAVVPARRSWLIVLPFRVLRADPDTEFLAFGLADAVTSSLSGLQSLGVRSSIVAAKFDGPAPDMERVAREAHVDLVLTGTLMRCGQDIRVNTQLVAAPEGTLLWSHTSQVTLRDVFQVQDDLVQRICGSLELPLTAQEHRLLRHDVPASATAYEFYLRGSEVSRVGLASIEQLRIGRDFLLRSVEEDPRFAPAWARLGRCYRVIGKGGEEPEENLARGESCMKRALELNPDLAVAHNLYAQLELDLGRSKDAMLRLVARAHVNGSDPEVFAGLVHACRYCGLLHASVRAHHRARQLDPHIATSVRHTYWLLGDAVTALQGSAPFFFEAMVLASTGREREALDTLRKSEPHQPEMMRAFLGSLRALLEGQRDESLDATERCLASFRDPEALYYMARQLAVLSQPDRAIAVLERVTDLGYLCSAAFERDPWLQTLKPLPACTALMQRIVAAEQDVARAFVQAGGTHVLDVPPA